MLIEKGANVNELDHYLSTPIHCASLHGHQPVICALVSNGGDCSLRGKFSNYYPTSIPKLFLISLWEIIYHSNLCSNKGHQGNSMLHLAASKGHLTLVQYFLQSCDILRKNVDIRNDLGETPLHSATKEFILGTYYRLNIWKLNLFI